MNLYTYEPKKTGEDLAARIRAIRSSLAEASVEGDAASIVSHANGIAEHEGAHGVIVAFERAAERLEENRTEGDDALHAFRLLSILVGGVVNGAEDTWSGRANDVRRARHDGRLAAVREIHQHLLSTLASVEPARTASV